MIMPSNALLNLRHETMCTYYGDFDDSKASAIVTPGGGGVFPGSIIFNTSARKSRVSTWRGIASDRH